MSDTVAWFITGVMVGTGATTIVFQFLVGRYVDACAELIEALADERGVSDE